MGATPVAPNKPNAKYRYEVTIATGLRSDGGTSAHVSCIIIGKNDDSGVCALKDPERRPFQRGNVNSFVISVPQSLGPIDGIRIWHDNAGRGPSWFLRGLVSY